MDNHSFLKKKKEIFKGRNELTIPLLPRGGRR